MLCHSFTDWHDWVGLDCLGRVSMRQIVQRAIGCQLNWACQSQSFACPVQSSPVQSSPVQWGLRLEFTSVRTLNRRLVRRNGLTRKCAIITIKLQPLRLSCAGRRLCGRLNAAAL